MKKYLLTFAALLMLTASAFCQNLNITALTPYGTHIHGKLFDIAYLFTYSGPEVPSETLIDFYIDGSIVWCCGGIFGYTTPFTIETLVPLPDLSKGNHACWFVVHNDTETETSNTVTVTK